MKLTEKQKTNFWKNVEVKGSADCWEWTAYKDRDGYGISNSKRAHRISAYLAGKDITGLHVCHHCDNPACVNPSHLFVGTNADNMLDKSLKGRVVVIPRPGEQNNFAKLTESKVLTIRQVYAESKRTYQSVADQFGISLQQAWNIINRKHWKHI